MDVDYPHEGNCLSASVLAFLSPGLQLVTVPCFLYKVSLIPGSFYFNIFHSSRDVSSNKVITFHIQTDQTILYND